MFIDSYYSQRGNRISFTREQGSAFAKTIADDFNPLHDADAKRFCIPGDLLVSVILGHYGLSRHMEFMFSGMVVDGMDLVLPEPGESLLLDDTEGRHYLSVQRRGENSRDESLVQDVARAYVEFSSHTFPDILVPLLEEQQLMINPARPLVIYQSMIIDLDTLDFTAPRLEIDHNELTTDGKRGNARLMFNFMAGEKLIGRGEKHVVLGGLLPFEEATAASTVSAFIDRREAFSRTPTDGGA